MPTAQVISAVGRMRHTIPSYKGIQLADEVKMQGLLTAEGAARSASFAFALTPVAEVREVVDASVDGTARSM